jgi:hypothetical protein
LSGVFENQDSAVVQLDFVWFPCGALVEAFRIGIGWIPRTVEPVKIRFVVGYPFFDRLPRWLDVFHGLDVERWRRWRWAWELDDAFPQAMEAEEELDLLGAFDGTDEFHGSFAARALERIGSPDFENHVAPEGAHGFGGLFWWGRDEEDF